MQQKTIKNFFSKRNQKKHTKSSTNKKKINKNLKRTKTKQKQKLKSIYI